VIEVQSLSFSYPGSSRPALTDINLSISEGEYVAVAGANGSGKSTLIRCLNGLLSPPPGSVLVDGRDPAKPEDRRLIRRSLALVFQSPMDQIVASVVEEDTAFGLENLGAPREEMVGRVQAALSSVGLLGERTRQTRFLSAGQQQRLAVAGAVVMNPRYIAFDEATSMIDPAGRADILNLIDSIVASGSAAIHVTHDMDEAVRARRVLVLSEGALVFDGSPFDLFRRKDLGALGLAVPRSWSLAMNLGLESRVGESASELGRRLASDRRKSEAGKPKGREDDSAPSSLSRSSGRSGSQAAGSSSAFRFENAFLRYLKGTINEKLAVIDASFDIPKGAIVALVGATGSGKSSVLQLMDALTFPDSGRVLSFGTDTSDDKADLRVVRMRAPLAVQRPESSLFEFYAGDEVSFGPRNQGLSGAALISRVEEAMAAVGLPFAEYRDRPSRSLSGGQKRRLALASVFSLDSEAILLDEPGAALDPVSRIILMDLVFSYARKGKTIVFATHSMEEAARADLVVVMVEGKIAIVGEPGRIFDLEWSDEWGLSRPFATQAAAAARREGLALPSGIVDEEGLLLAVRTEAQGYEKRHLHEES